MHNPEPYLYSYIDSCLAHIQCTEAAAVRIKILYLMQNIVLLLDLSREEGSIVFPLFICSVSTVNLHLTLKCWTLPLCVCACQLELPCLDRSSLSLHLKHLAKGFYLPRNRYCWWATAALPAI